MEIQGAFHSPYLFQHSPDPPTAPTLSARSEDSELTMEMLDLIHEHLAVERMGILNAIALAAHNFPEGLATFVSALADPIMGGAVAIALILHNVPEGLSVAVPVSQATGSKWAGFWWGASTGISELLGGLFGYLILANNMNDRAMGLIFGLVAGIMVYIVIW